MKKKNSLSSVQYTSLKSSDDHDDDNGEDFRGISFKKQISRQDESLDAFADSVSRLGAMSLTISDEITSQHKLLSDLETDVAHATSSLYTY